MGDQKTDLVVMQRHSKHYIDDVLHTQAIPFFHKVLVSLTIMTMQYPITNALIARQFLAQNNADDLNQKMNDF